MQLAGNAAALFILHTHQIAGEVAKTFLGAFLVGDVGIDFDDHWGALLLFQQRPPAAHQAALAVPASLRQFAFPVSGLHQLRLDFFEWIGKLRTQQFMGNPADGLVSLPTVGFFRPAIPELYVALQITHDNRIASQVQKGRLPLQLLELRPLFGDIIDR